MSTTTTNYNLVKPDLTDVADITTMNANWDTVDSALYSLSSTSGGNNELMFTINALLSDDVRLRDWAFRQNNIGEAINEAFDLGSDELASCTSVEEIANNETAITAINTNGGAIITCMYNRTLSNVVDKDEETILASGYGYMFYDVGDLVHLNYNGSEIPFRVVHKNYKTNNTIVLVSEDILTTQTWSSGVNNYSTSNLRSYLNSTVLSGFSDEIQNAIVELDVECHDGKTAVNCADKIWALSHTEIGFADSTNAPSEGTALEYFNTELSRTKKLSDVATTWWLRTPYTSGTSSAWSVSDSGAYSSGGVTNSNGVVPAFEI